MALVGDVIMSARELGPDLPSRVLAVPLNTELSLSAVSTPAGYTALPVGSNYFRITYLNPWGETYSGPEHVVTVLSGMTVTLSGTLPLGVTGFRVYQAAMLSPSGISWDHGRFFYGTTLPFTIDAAQGQPGMHPAISSAYLPDSDGKFVSAATMYRWLNEAFDKSGLATKGVRDQTGVRMVNGVGSYLLTGRWTKINEMWYDGWLMSRQSTINFYYHNTATGISWMADVTKVTNTGLVLAVWPQANRTGSTTTLSSALSATGTQALITASTGFLALGLVQIGTEVCEYGPSGVGQLNGLVRGIGGTAAQAWPIGTIVTELNLRIQGLRLPTKNVLGDAYKTLDVPYGVESILTTYLLHKFREAEQEGAESKRLLDVFFAELLKFARSNRQLSGPTQVGGVARETYGSGLGGGWFLP